MRFEIRHYPNASYDDDADMWDLGNPRETIDAFDVEFPAQARARVMRAYPGVEYIECDMETAAIAWRSGSEVFGLVRVT
jgi:hypothetical protein